MAPVLNKVHLKVSEHEMLGFSVRREIIKNDNSLAVILLSKVVENELHYRKMKGTMYIMFRAS